MGRFCAAAQVEVGFNDLLFPTPKGFRRVIQGVINLARRIGEIQEQHERLFQAEGTAPNPPPPAVRAHFLLRLLSLENTLIFSIVDGVVNCRSRDSPITG